MSTDYMLLKKPPTDDGIPVVQDMAKIAVVDFFDGRLAAFGVSERVNENTTERSRCLTDGRNHLWVYVDDDGFISVLTRYLPNGAPGKILDAIAEAFDVDIVSEYEPQFWGFATQEEHDAAMEKMAQEADDRLYEELLQYLRGEPHRYEPGQNGAAWLETGKKLVEKDPSLLSPENKPKLLEAMRSSTRVTVTLTPENVEVAKMIVTHEDDLPQA